MATDLVGEEARAGAIAVTGASRAADMLLSPLAVAAAVLVMPLAAATAVLGALLCVPGPARRTS